ncbi:hypothetical protein [Kineosporia sp. R_H_3]|uniref:hypothetical protein n=1 Tax=Kineosporia sp. R_H_3 TaxID=1961848 RepID=UPI000B4BB805|nr:hypothetical protein [Kineosporia sp. R_H_3]
MRGRRGPRRALGPAGALTLALVLALGPAAPAAAHGAGGGDAPFYRSRVTGISPAVDGVTVDLARDGSWVQVRNTTAVDLVLLGYDGEPYLRVGPQGAQENVGSVTSRVNGRFGSGLVTADSPTAQVARPPRWEPLGLEPVVTWHDARTHYGGLGRPAAVVDDPSRPHALTTWRLRGLYGDRPFTVDGRLDWTGRGLLGSRTTQALWVVGGLAGLACVLLVVAGLRRPGGPGRRQVKIGE